MQFENRSRRRSETTTTTVDDKERLRRPAGCSAHIEGDRDDRGGHRQVAALLAFAHVGFEQLGPAAT